MRIYRLSRAGKKIVRIPSPDRCPVLDFLYEHPTASLEELENVNKDARSKLRDYLKRGIVEEFSK